MEDMEIENNRITELIIERDVLRSENERLYVRISELIEQADATYLPYREMVIAARDETNKFSSLVLKLREAVSQIVELAIFDIDHEENGNTYQIEAIARSILEDTK